MKRTQLRDEAKKLKRPGIRCQVCGMAPALRRDRRGRAVCAKNHKKEK